MKNNKYTGIGINNIPAKYSSRVVKIANKLSSLGYTLRSGYNYGTDMTFASIKHDRMEIFVPRRRFNGSDSPRFIIPKNTSAITRKYHPIYDRLDTLGQQLNDTRVLQLLGRSLATPSRFVICYTDDGAESYKEGVNTENGMGLVLKICDAYKIKVYNIKNDKSYKTLIDNISGDGDKIKIKGREAKFIFHLKEIPGYRPDTHIVKEAVHMSDGTVISNLKIIKDFKRPFWVTKEHLRNHKTKKESELLENTNVYRATQSQLHTHIAARLDSRYVGVRNMRGVIDSPYLYGCDVDSKAIMKKAYQDRYPDITASTFEVATLDIETDTEDGDIAIISLSTDKKIYTAINKKYIKQSNIDVKKELKYMFDKHIPKTDITSHIEVEYAILNNELELVTEVLAKAHIWRPDIIAIWNIDYDLPYMVKTLEKHGVKPKDVFSDPSLPRNLRYFRYKEGQKQKVTESGKFKPVNPEERWNVVDCPATFYWVDAMAAHRYVRVGGKTVPGGYSLDNILKAELGSKLQKLKFETEETTGIQGIEWHQYMLNNKFLEYIIYNQWDNISMLQLDQKTKDLSNNLPLLSGISSFDIFNSGPKRIIDAMHFFYLEKGSVLGTKPTRTNKDKILGLDNWIVLLPSSRIKENGLKCIEENDKLITNIRAHVADADQVSGYPSNTQAANVSIDTTSKEIIDIAGYDIPTFKAQNINLLFGKVNFADYAQTLFKFPSFRELSDMVDEKIK